MSDYRNRQNSPRTLTSVVIVTAIAALVWFDLRVRGVETPTTVPVTTPQAAGYGPASNEVASPGNTSAQKPGGPYVSSDPRWAIARQRDQVDHNWEWKMPIDFYGRVEDENGQPVPGARVEFSWTDLSAAGNSTAIGLSDSNGAFSLQKKIGRVLQVDVSKEGFYKPRSERLKSFDYAGFWEASYYQPDAIHPVTFHLRKKGRTERLSSGEVEVPLSADGTPVRLDLLHSVHVSRDGQIEIAAITNTEKYPPPVFDWQASLTVIDGGLLKHATEFPFEAPTQGYTSNDIISMPAGSPDWRRTVEQSYFIRFGSPAKYGRIHVRFNGATQKVFLSYAINPAGLRNLEGDVAP